MTGRTCGLILCCTSLIGCAGPGTPRHNAAAPPAWSDQARVETYTHHSPYLVLDHPALQYRQARAGEPLPAQPPWWEQRNDARMSIRAGYRSAEVINYVTETVDRQRSYGDRIYNTYYQTTYSSRYGQIVR